MLALEIAAGIVLAVVLFRVGPKPLLLVIIALGIWWLSTWSRQDVLAVTGTIVGSWALLSLPDGVKWMRTRRQARHRPL
jgi:hypothetical protein